MYETFFGFHERPFDLAPDPRFLVLTDSHAEALSTLEYGVSSRKGITLLTGDAGLGKTTLIRAALEHQPARVRWIHLQNPVLSRAEFVEMLARRFRLSPQAATSKTALLCELEDLLGEARQRDETTLLVFDEAQSLPYDLLEEIRLLANIETGSARMLSVIIAGQPELADRLEEPSLRQFKQRIALRCALRPLTDQETARYIAGRVKAAGGTGAEAFTREAVSEIHQRSGGVPRTISVVADNALLGGFAAGVKPVSSSIVRDVCRDLRLQAPVPAPGRNGHHAGLFPTVAAGARAQAGPGRSRAGESDEPAGKTPVRSLFEAVTKRRRFTFFGG